MRFWSRLGKKDTPKDAKIGISLVTYGKADGLASLIHALKEQTFPNFKIFIFHDGPWLSMDDKVVCDMAIAGDRRFDVICTAERANKFGHNMRQPGFDLAIKFGCNWIGTMNADSWYAPTYFEWMLSEANRMKASFVYCNMVHSHKLWAPIKTELKRGKIDAGAWLASSALSSLVKWDSLDFAADWFYIDNLMKQPSFSAAKVDGYLFTHN
jgi:hypothetical protein